ncbi:hypothetical protein DNU06_00850 [Putridiphycobacter roseus]|uniref:Uncharacterized protein n=1 Tax=Putridiphycobacter roseus TaxID=2219161 RepID=A0A2W1NFZ5_9FLAO|nr:hypothetical protein [Putridiphycobacter roseus]PZE18415.1 hypothetical protein DNU06_00850 [Putridiphycobacter roseus]
MKKKEALESWITDLIENKDFNELSTLEQNHVLEHITAEDYALERAIIVESKQLFLLADDYEPKQWLNENRSGGFLSATIPLYQALLAIAAVFLLLYIVFPFTRVVTEENGSHLTAQVDTLWLETIRYDTVEVVLEKEVVKEKIVYVSQAAGQVGNKEKPRLFNVPPSNFKPDLNAINFPNKGFSLKDDSMRISLPNVN